MKAFVQNSYGTPDVLTLQEVALPPGWIALWSVFTPLSRLTPPAATCG